MAYGTIAGHRTHRPSTQLLSTASLVIPAAIVAASVLMLIALVPPPLVLPALSLQALAGAGIMALVAWFGRAEQNSDGITHWDVSGAFAFIGFAAGMLSERQPEKILQILGLATTAQ